MYDTYLLVRLPCRVDHPSLEARAADFITDYIALPVGAAAGLSQQPGKAPERGWACRAADLIEPTYQRDSVMSAHGATSAPTGGVVSESGDPSTRLQHQPSNLHSW